MNKDLNLKNKKPKLCERCKKKKAVAWFHGENVCSECYNYLKNGNGHLIGRKLGWRYLIKV